MSYLPGRNRAGIWYLVAPHQQQGFGVRPMYRQATHSGGTGLCDGHIGVWESPCCNQASAWLELGLGYGRLQQPAIT